MLGKKWVISHVLDEAKMMCCCINNLVQTQDNNPKDIHARLTHCGISMAYMKASTLKNLLMRHKGLHMEWSHIIKLATLKDSYTNNLNE